MFNPGAGWNAGISSTFRNIAMTIEKVDLVIVGAGPAGLAAAAEVGRQDGKVVVLDESPYAGGRLPSLRLPGTAPVPGPTVPPKPKS